MLKTLILLYRATQLEKYKTEAEQLVKEISNTFDSKKGYFYTYVGNSAIKAPYNVTENIEACRLLNYCSHFFHEPEYKKTASGLLDFLTSEKLVNSISTEPGILSAAEELSYEPTNAALLIKKGEDLKAAFLTSSIAFPCFYFNSSVYTKDNIIEDKKDWYIIYELPNKSKNNIAYSSIKNIIKCNFISQKITEKVLPIKISAISMPWHLAMEVAQWIQLV